MHDEATHFLQYVASVSKTHFTRGKLVLDVGSFDYNGSNKQLFDTSCKIHGNDVFPGRNVDLVYKTSELPFFEPTFDTIVSSNCFQHDPDYKESLRKLTQILRPGGILAFTCATTGKPEHGTKKNKPEMSLATRSGLSKWRDYYKPLTFEDIKDYLNLAEFQSYAVFSNIVSKDLFFAGLKKDPRRPDFTLDFSNYPNFAGNIERVAAFSFQERHEPSATPQPDLNAVLTYEQLTDAEKALVQSYLESLPQT
jgi:SAM-dependent methyltransferase